MRHYKGHRRHNRKQKKIIIVSIISLMFIMGVGYAAFQTNLNITAKGNILAKELTTDDLKNLAVTEGDGLYEDSYEDGRYIYRGQEPNNYIKFSDELWRIVAIESDNTLKIIKDEIMEKITFDTIGNRTTGYCSQGRAPNEGCNAYGIISGTFTNGQYSGAVTKDSYISTYLNGTFYNTLNDTDKNYITTHDFKMGPIDYEQTTMNGTITQENKYKWNGKIGLINATDYMRASLDSACTDITSAREGKFPCKNSNYLIHSVDESYIWWTMHAYTGVAHRPVYVNNNGFISSTYSASYTEAYIRPVVFLNSNIILTGEGTENNPYKILNE